MERTTIGRYRIVDRLGQGGMGVVYRAFDPQIERTVAIKVISTQLIDQPEHRERFFREARAAGRLTHRNIITIFDFGEDEGQPFIAMEYVEGQSLDVRLRHGEPLTLSQKIAVVMEICDALAFAHGNGIVHRDMKPGNVMLTRGGGVRILDFGLARLVTSELTRSNAVVGTMNYMAPEQIRAEPVDRRADVFSTGVLFYELLTGRKAFEADSFAATMYKVLQERPAAVTQVAEGIPQEVVAIVDRAIEKDRERRYQSMDSMLRDLLQVRAALPAPAPIQLADDADVTLAGMSSGPTSGPPAEPETTLDAAAPLRHGTPSPTPYLQPSGASPAGARAASVAHTQPRVASAPEALPPPPASDSGIVPTPGSRLVPIVSAAALVVIAIAVVVFVLRPPGRAGAPPAERQPSEATRQPAQTPPAAAAPAPANPVLEAETPAVSITDDLAQQTESARALYRAGKYDEAARAAGRVLQRAPGDAEAQRLMSDLARYARQAAAEALAGLGAARTRAESAGAPAAAGGALARAIEAEHNARRLFGAGDYARAATAGYAAQGLFDAAATEALGRSQADPEPQPPPPAPTPPPAPSLVAPSSGVARAETALPPVATVPVPAPAPPPSRPATPAVTDRPAPDPQDAIQRTLQEYVSALEARSLSALKQVWPGLGGAQERAISTEFGNARSISVRLDSPRIEVSGNTATVIATRRYALSTVDGHELRSDTRTTMQLHLVGTSWIIDSVRFEAER